MKTLMIIALVFGLGYSLLVLLVWSFQHRLVFYPSHDFYAAPDAISLPFEDVFMTTEDTVKIHSWFVPARPSQRLGTILFFHGNAGNITHRLDTIRLFNQMDHDVFIIDYRGYGQSEGAVSESGTYKDATAAYDYLTIERQIPADEIVIFGRSLGGGVASELATRKPSRAVILESTFTSIADMGVATYPYLPVRLLSRIHYPNLKNIEKIEADILIIHSTEDELIPYDHGRILFKKAKEKARFLQISGDHGNGFMTSGRTYTEGLFTYLEEIQRKTTPGR
ncbi:alpha/beta hydrolase [Terasakiella sp. A23]|uniref:alpha/beta hydrolase n=1 Tax=Terasakiella sp. FCG-A23 TaxID=3080561 RepID=UPI00295394B0|nr:alpha/beta hydrolase [Terasakiella sp. A23]MDV7338057.1 alpha/beta hydrolase [Terasakiella sp. A23]